MLRHNYEQNVLIGNGRLQKAGHGRRSTSGSSATSVSTAGLDPALEFLPDDAEWARREEAGTGLTAPEFSVLVAYAKLGIKTELSETELPDDPALLGRCMGYFPEPLRERAREQILDHPLRREIVVNEIANAMVNRGGVSFAFRAQEETGATVVQIARAFHVVRAVFGLADYTDAVEALDNQVPTDDRRPSSTSRSAGCWTAPPGGSSTTGRCPAAWTAEIERFAEPVQTLAPRWVSSSRATSRSAGRSGPSGRGRTASRRGPRPDLRLAAGQLLAAGRRRARRGDRPRRRRRWPRSTSGCPRPSAWTTC